MSLLPKLTIIAIAIGVLPARADTLYDISFGQFTAGSPYTTASGAPNDFSSYFPNYSTNVVSSSVISSALGLNDQPLLCSSTSASAFGIFSMTLGNVSSSIVTLDMQLGLDSTVDAGVEFFGSSGSYRTGLTLSFAGGTMSIQSFDGLIFSGETLYLNSTNFSRAAIQEIHFSLNVPARTFDLAVNGFNFALNAPIGTNVPIDSANIHLGDVGSVGAYGQAAIDNIFVSATVIPEPSAFVLLAVGLAGIFGLHRRRRQACR